MRLDSLFKNFETAVAIVYDDHANVLLGRATNNDDRKGKWCFPAGAIDPGETPMEAAVRECWEETGFTAKAQQKAYMLVPKKPWLGFVVCRKVSGEMNPNGEFTELQWVPWNRVLGMPDLYPDVAHVVTQPIAGFP